MYSRGLLTIGLLAYALPSVQALSSAKSTQIRTVITTDMEQDDLASLVRYMLYTNELDTQGIIYSSSEWHWAGDGKGTLMVPHTATDASASWRWTGCSTIQDKVLAQYAVVYPNLKAQDPGYPTPDELLSLVKIGNIDFESDMSKDTDGSNLIKKLLLDNDPRTLYMQAWGGTNTIARALKSIEDEYSSSPRWSQIRKAVSTKGVLMASGFQDDTWTNYIALSWAQLRVEDMSRGYHTWAYNCNTGHGNSRGAPNDIMYFNGTWIHPNIEMGPYGMLYRSWLDGQHMPGDPMDVFGNLSTVGRETSCPHLNPYDFLSEGDNVAYFPLLTTGIQDPSNPNLGSWGGRATQNSTTPNLWQMVLTEKVANGTEVADWTTLRWVPAVQNDFAARMHWTITPEYKNANHAPSVTIVNGSTVKARAGSTVQLSSRVSDPDGNHVNVSWWQFFEEGTYAGVATVTPNSKGGAAVKVPADAKSGQIISIILEGTDNGQFPLTRYARIFIQVE